MTKCKSEVTTCCPKVPATKISQLHSIMKPEASSTTKATDKQLAKVQTLLLDLLAPLTMLLEAHHRGDESDPKDVVRAVKAVVELIGNANAHMSNLRRVKVIGDSNSLYSIVPNSISALFYDKTYFWHACRTAIAQILQ